MSHDDICPCYHGNFVCLIGCEKCTPGLFIHDDWWERARSEYHRIAVDNEALLKASRELLAGQQDWPRSAGKVDKDTVCFSDRLVTNLREVVYRRLPTSR